MKATELRIGNYLHTLSQNKITGVSENKIKAENKNWYDKDIFRPIPLTEEWLLKFGLVMIKEEDRTIYCNESIEVSDKLFVYFSVGKDGRFVGIRIVQYVHELQNLYFSLTAEELILNTEIE